MISTSARLPLACLPLAHCARAWLTAALLCSSGCTLYHSKQALAPEPTQGPPPAAAAHFVTEEDSGLSLFGVFVLAEPDHYAVLLERLRRDHRCARLSYPQLDFYTDHWLLIAFPIARITSLCDPEPRDPEPRDPEPRDPEPRDPEPRDREPRDPEPLPGSVILPLPESTPPPTAEPP